MLIPYELTTVNERLLLRWINPDRLELRPGFFHEAVEALPQEEQCAGLTHFDELLNGEGAEPQPAGLIFHTSRCGSTLVCQMLKQHPQALVLGEPFLLNQIVRHHLLSPARKIEALRRCTGLWAQWAAETGRRLVIKLSSWNLMHIDLYQRAFDCPMLCLYRDYLSVLESLLRGTPKWLGADWPPRPFTEVDARLLPDASLLAPLQSGVMSAESKLLGTAAGTYLGFGRAMLAALESDASVRVMGYESIAGASAALAEHFGLQPYSGLQQDMSEATQLYSKGDSTYQPPDARDKLKRLDAQLEQHYPAMRLALQEVYSRLQSHRQLLG
ncbi:conserved hypothetical protein [Hahella chejuensis KCTC 2396]|uniref:Sulfotransferase family protein n=1 Tax=Hahella chejuensis (strain KCTC 2396) TaxID=349521 RepID=Q2SMQ5_HAHCH|nr:hypothetical protein [Hahella chejuensis]ABC28069.1 conserved hypothetical protein [Hahella chejuensis KCTC 2396]